MECDRQCDCSRDIRRAGAQTTFLPAAADNRLDGHAATGEQCAQAFRRAEFVSGNRERVGVKTAEIHGNCACRLHGVHMDGHCGIMADAYRVAHRLNRAHLIVRHHDACQGRTLLGLAGEYVKVDMGLSVDRNAHHLEIEEIMQPLR